MNVMFVENKYKTSLYEAVAKELRKQGHKICFLVQNKIFAPDENCKVLVSENVEDNKTDVNVCLEKNLNRVASSDRSVNYFGGNTAHYESYFNQINEAILEFKPNIVFGESTLFHELITISLCESKNIPYYHPASCRIPGGRFSFYSRDTLNAHGGSQEQLSQQEKENLVSAYGKRDKTPDYMRKRNFLTNAFRKTKLFRNWLVGFYSNIIGEKYNTPTLKQKAKLESQLKKDLSRWEKNATRELNSTKHKLLYPLHIQPECNVDVWSREYRTQHQTIQRISEVLPSDWELIVKLNPKSKYEVNGELIDVCQEMDNVVLLNKTVLMNEIIEQIDLVITASGTVAYECLFTDKPCLSLCLPFFSEKLQYRHLNNICWQEIEDKYKRQLESRNDSELLIDYLVATSYVGIISDPISDSKCTSRDNIRNLASAFTEFLNSSCVRTADKVE